MTDFSELEECVKLSKLGRMKPAKKRWNALPEDFRKRMLQFVSGLYTDLSDEIEGCPAVVMKSKFGEFVISESWLTDVKTQIPKLIG